MYRKITILCLLAVLCGCTSSNQGWQKEASGVWKISFGSPDKTNLTSALSFTPRLDAIDAMSDEAFPLDKDEIYLETFDGKTYVRFPLDKDEQIYGLGLNFRSLGQRGSIKRLHVDHYGGADNGRSHAPVPFFVSSKGYGAFINAARYIDVYCGTGVRKDSKNPPEVRDRNTDRNWTATPYSDNLEFLIPAEGVEIVLFAGPTMLDAVRRFNLYNGGGVLPPKWGLGFWQRVPTLYSDSQVLEEVEEFERRGFPLSVIGLEPGWQSHSYPCSYEWDKTRYPDPEGFAKLMADHGIRLNLWMNPGIAPGTELSGKLEPYSGSHTEWCGFVPDYTLPETRSIVKDHLVRNQLEIGVSGFKVDENDGYDNWIFPDVARFPSGLGAEQMRQIYGSLMQDTQLEMFRERNQRTYGLVRAGNAGTVSFPYVIYNDYYDHRHFINALVNSSFIGILWTPEVRASKTAEEWVRRMQTVCFSPLAMLNAWADGTKPWSYPEVEAEVNYAASLRIRLFPYLYTTYAEYCFRGTPPTRALVLEKGYEDRSIVEGGVLDGTDNPYAMATRKDIMDQYMVGESLLVAPLFAGETERDVILPRGSKWYDFYTGEYAGEGEVIKVSPGLGRIPVFVKDGGIIPMLPSGARPDDTAQPLEIHYYGTRPSEFHLYDDDGETFDYENGKYSWITIKVDGSRNVSLDLPSTMWSYNGEHTLITSGIE